ncbi:MAG: NAD(P)-dependent glycerol-3-phosphate dehydrogenase [Actinobacteria bacterium]|nr:NAD(P)-dependent glycerol-3-phosphate dehydrogenase [Actinomycetota bacterium]
MTTIAVMGAGSWGSTLASVFADAGNDVVIWARSQSIVDEVNESHTNHAYQPGLTLPASVMATADARQALAAAELVVLAIPAQSLRANLGEWGSQIPATAIVLSLMKGIELSTGLRITQVVHEVAGVPFERLAVLSGPNLADEIAHGEPAATTVAAYDEHVAELVQRCCTTARFRPYTSTDVLGTEIVGAAKNVVALAAGIAIGLGFGENAQAALITRGLAEIARLGVALGANPVTFSGLAGMGDLVATCGSPLSRNRTFGVHLGQGRSVDEATSLAKGVCEGVPTSRALLELAHAHNVEMPITEQMVEVLYHELAPSTMLQRFMGREVKSEN